MNVSPINLKQELVKDYYGKVLKTSGDLKTNACCTTDALPEHIKTIIKNIEPEVVAKFYGCGSPIPYGLEGCTVLDLGCGSGRDVFVVSSLVGEKGRVIGVDMTDEQLDVARLHVDRQMRRFEFKKTNVDFKKGYIEDLKSLGIEDNSIDVVISNCVINLSPDKQKVFSEIFRVLKPGGELYFADVFSNARVSKEFHDDALAYGECLGGALYIEDFRRMLATLGCLDYRVIKSSKITIADKAIAQKSGHIDFYSMTIRAFKLKDVEDRCEDFGQVAYYLGTVEGLPQQFILDDHHVFVAHKPMLVCGNTAAMISESRHAKHFKIIGNKERHFGLFPCGSSVEVSQSTGSCC